MYVCMYVCMYVHVCMMVNMKGRAKMTVTVCVCMNEYSKVIMYVCMSYVRI